ncbi:MAG TPA: MOSC domain-containing protein [Rhizomicrobium sp.]|jgi:MOSC domain-containing protein YiiM|nr:MOSC domain-containing protein [Rhizomicrobium sp.]
MVTLLSVNCGVGRVIGQRNGRPVRSAISKSPVTGDRVFFGREGVAGDQQSNRLLHGGVDQAICAYDAGHWPWWHTEKNLTCSEGTFGENLTLLGANEDSVCIGDRFAWDEVILEVTQPRGPCANIDLYHGRVDLAQAITRSGRCGWYMRVIREGDASARNAIIRHIRAPGKPTVKEAFVARYDSRTPLALRRRVHEISQLSSNWRRAISRGLS